jgi:hypothetical protein
MITAICVETLNVESTTNDKMAQQVKYRNGKKCLQRTLRDELCEDHRGPVQKYLSEAVSRKKREKKRNTA